MKYATFQNFDENLQLLSENRNFLVLLIKATTPLTRGCCLSLFGRPLKSSVWYLSSVVCLPVMHVLWLNGTAQQKLYK